MSAGQQVQPIWQSNVKYNCTQEQHLVSGLWMHSFTYAYTCLNTYLPNTRTYHMLQIKRCEAPATFLGIMLLLAFKNSITGIYHQLPCAPSHSSPSLDCDLIHVLISSNSPFKSEILLRIFFCNLSQCYWVSRSCPGN